MQYKTIILELLQQRPQVHNQLREDRSLFPTIELHAKELKTSHEAWKKTLRQAKSDSDESQIASEALELALAELENRLPPVSLPDDAAPLSLDEAMVSIRRHTSNG